MPAITCNYKGCHYTSLDVLVFNGKTYCPAHYKRMKAGQRGGVLLQSGTCQEIANYQNMILYGTRYQELSSGTHKPIFPGQDSYPSATSHITYLVWRKNTPILSPIKLKFIFDVRNDYAEVRTSDSGVRQLNATAPEAQERMLNEARNHKSAKAPIEVKQ